MTAALGVGASDSACLYVVATPADPYFRGPTNDISLLAVGDIARSWPGGTGSYTLGLRAYFLASSNRGQERLRSS